MSHPVHLHNIALRLRALVLLLVCTSQIHAESALAVRNTTPVAQLFGLPLAQGALTASERTALQFSVAHGSNFSSDRDGADIAFFDGETSVFSWRAAQRLGDSWEVGLEIPYVMHAGGFLDGVIDGFHDLFGLPGGGRDLARDNQLDYLVRLDGATAVNLDGHEHDLGDIRLQASRYFGQQSNRGYVVRLLLKLPTGDVQTLSGSEGTDVGVSIEHARTGVFGVDALGVSGMLGATYLGNADLARRRQKDIAYSGHIGVQYAIHPRVVLHAQLDGHTRLYDTSLPQIGGAALQGTLGGRIKFKPQLWMDVGVLEDLRSQSASDVVFQVALGARF